MEQWGRWLEPRLYFEREPTGTHDIFKMGVRRKDESS